MIVRSIFGTASKADRAMQTPLVGSSWPVAKSGRFHDPASPYLHPADVDIALPDLQRALITCDPSRPGSN
jgi:hypothetical protein